MSFLRKITQLGIEPSYPEVLKRHIEISNFVAFVYILVTIPFLLLQASHPLVLLVRSMPIWAALIIWGLMAIHRHRLARFVLSISFPLMIYIMGVLLLINDGTFGMAPKFWIIGSVSIPFLVFDYKERGYILASIVLDLLLYLSFDKVNAMFNLPGLTMNLDSVRMRIMAGLGAMLMIALITFYVKKQLFEKNEQLYITAEDLKQKNQELTAAEEELKQNFEELKTLNEQIQRHKDRLEKILEDLNASLKYATYIQKAILLPYKEVLKQNFTEYFVLFRPKQQISGDFYYFSKVDNKIVLALGDSTGHGVPGALMSMLGISLLNEAFATKQTSHPSQVLEFMRSRIINYLHQENTMLNDGFEMAICLYEPQTRKLQFAGAHLSLYVAHGDKIEQIRGDKMPVSLYFKNEHFTDYSVSLEAGDVLYMFSDGFQDQFGGPENKKFGKKNFVSLLSQIASLPLNNQQQILNEIIDEWMRNNQQIDDITVIGIRV